MSIMLLSNDVVINQQADLSANSSKFSVFCCDCYKYMYCALIVHYKYVYCALQLHVFCVIVHYKYMYSTVCIH